jgi:hypothetical protein
MQMILRSGIVVALAGGLLVGCGGDKASTTELAITAVDYGFEGAPATVPAGLVTLTLTNSSQAEEHQATLIRLNDGVTAEQFQQAGAESEAEAFKLIAGFGGPSPIGPGGTGTTTQVLEPGNFLMVCFIPSPSDGVAHAEKGMVDPFTVGEGAEAELEEGDATITGQDFSFSIPEGFTGNGTITFQNDGPQQHEVAIYRIADGKTFADVQAFFSPEPPEGPPPFQDGSGVAALAAGSSVNVELDLTSGPYVFMCFLPDTAGDGAPHFTKGMMQEVTIG